MSRNEAAEGGALYVEGIDSSVLAEATNFSHSLASRRGVASSRAALRSYPT